MDYKEKQQAASKFREVLSQGLYTKEELAVIADAFYDNEELLTAIRNFFFQFELTAAEISIINEFVKTDAYSILYKTFLPELSSDAPITHNVDLWVSINTKEKLPEDSVLEMRARLIVVNYLKEQFNRMEKGTSENIKLSDMVYAESKSTDQAFIEMSARNSIISQISGNLTNLRNTAFQEKTKMTPDEISKMLKLRSNK